MTPLTMHRASTSPTLRQATVLSQLVGWVDVINAAAAVLRPLVITVGVIAAAATWPAPAHADPLGDSMTNAVNNIGVANNGAVSTGIAGVGQSVCPMLVHRSPSQGVVLAADSAAGVSMTAAASDAWRPVKAGRPP